MHSIKTKARCLTPSSLVQRGDKLAATIQQQRTLGFCTSYNDLSHDIQIVFYSPEGLSIQLIDNVEYDEEVFDHDKVLAKQRVHGRYIAILTPAEARWRVRLFQAAPSVRVLSTFVKLKSSKSPARWLCSPARALQAQARKESVVVRESTQGVKK